MNKKVQEIIAPGVVREGHCVIITNPKCSVCGNGSVSRVDELKYYLWKGGASVDAMFPRMTHSEKQLITSGIHAYCERKSVGK
jgi:hypothetical protein